MQVASNAVPLVESLVKMQIPLLVRGSQPQAVRHDADAADSERG